MAKAFTFTKWANFVIWLIGMMVLLHNFDVMVATVSIWGFLAVAMLWAVFCIRQTR